MLTAEAKKRNLESYETYIATYCGGEKVAEVPEREEPQNEVAAGRRDRVSEAEAGRRGTVAGCEHNVGSVFYSHDIMLHTPECVHYPTKLVRSDKVRVRAPYQKTTFCEKHGVCAEKEIIAALHTRHYKHDWRTLTILLLGDAPPEKTKLKQYWSSDEHYTFHYSAGIGGTYTFIGYQTVVQCIHHLCKRLSRISTHLTSKLDASTMKTYMEAVWLYRMHREALRRAGEKFRYPPSKSHRFRQIVVFGAPAVIIETAAQYATLILTSQSARSLGGDASEIWIGADQGGATYLITDMRPIGAGGQSTLLRLATGLRHPVTEGTQVYVGSRMLRTAGDHIQHVRETVWTCNCPNKLKRSHSTICVQDVTSTVDKTVRRLPARSKCKHKFIWWRIVRHKAWADNGDGLLREDTDALARVYGHFRCTHDRLCKCLNCKSRLLGPTHDDDGKMWGSIVSMATPEKTG